MLYRDLCGGDTVVLADGAALLLTCIHMHTVGLAIETSSEFFCCQRLTSVR